MDASYVIGQDNFTSSDTGVSATRIKSAESVADVVIGQGNFTSSSANQGGSANANTLNFPWGIECDSKGRLFIDDMSNNRILL
ncbi:hypothetical protein A3C26_03245 [Candidatus Daviesbacteria bacterium RIFCSPHIGHO2_02_FULL_39_12]|uniref:Uncharacterized protein n=2 Tax=Candidatus Daviesiibacteriota TaxID=1752718 RepID=A0A1F5JE66_9BACT|nr:MAG: hypothetical protein A3C26_03245 [Candidatus Daviesbacteria bacterium RIFCSPHIGHO2_02_FULL_39_12]OGE71900.1 MAG: hypothetical protein A3H40_03400 [Candidatus Daviesbacteria bacterium RIFCSPLOWO2_02_FULL_38_15]